MFPGRGRYGTVWKASLDEVVGGHVAVKVFNPSTRNFFNNERDIYSLPFMDHANIVGFVGHQEFHSSAGPVQYRLILEYAPYGSLQVRFLIHLHRYCLVHLTYLLRIHVKVAKNSLKNHSKIHRKNPLEILEEFPKKIHQKFLKNSKIPKTSTNKIP